jgi:hypothetical protein
MAPNPFASGVFYSICQPIIVGCTLYTDALLTTLAPNQYYSDGTWCYEVFGNGVVIAKTSVEDCFITTTSTTTTTTSTVNGHYVQKMYVLPYDAEQPYFWCNYNYDGIDEQTVYIDNQNPTALGAGQYLSLSDSTCVNSFNGVPIANYQFLWINPDDSLDQRLYRINNLCIITAQWQCPF